MNRVCIHEFEVAGVVEHHGERVRARPARLRGAGQRLAPRAALIRPPLRLLAPPAAQHRGRDLVEPDVAERRQNGTILAQFALAVRLRPTRRRGHCPRPRPPSPRTVGASCRPPRSRTCPLAPETAERELALEDPSSAPTRRSSGRPDGLYPPHPAVPTSAASLPFSRPATRWPPSPRKSDTQPPPASDLNARRVCQPRNSLSVSPPHGTAGPKGVQ